MGREAAFGDEITEVECAFVTVPGGLPPNMWPVTARVEIPEDFPFEAVTPLEVILEYPDARAEFLFAAR
jgi:hypothetical protein